MNENTYENLCDDNRRDFDRVRDALCAAGVATRCSLLRPDPDLIERTLESLGAEYVTRKPAPGATWLLPIGLDVVVYVSDELLAVTARKATQFTWRVPMDEGAEEIREMRADGEGS